MFLDDLSEPKVQIFDSISSSAHFKEICFSIVSLAILPSFKAATFDPSSTIQSSRFEIWVARHSIFCPFELGDSTGQTERLGEDIASQHHSDKNF